MSTPQTRLDSIRPSVREDLRHVTELLGNSPAATTELRSWNDATHRLQRVAAAFEALDDKPLAQLSKACLEFTHLLASRQFENSAEACQRLLACLQVLAEHNHLISASHPNTEWQACLLDALGATSGTDATGNRGSQTHSDYQDAASQYVNAYQEALLNWLTGRETDHALAQIAHILQSLKADMTSTPLADLTDLSIAWRDKVLPVDGHARQCLSRGERLLQQMAAGQDFSQRSSDLQAKMQPLLQQLPSNLRDGITIDVDAVNNSGYWLPYRPAPADHEAWTGLAAALRDDLRFVIESFDIATRVAPTQAPDMQVVADRVRAASNVLAATDLNDWAEQLAAIADRTAQGPNRAQCLRLAEQIQDVMACLEPEVIEQRQGQAGRSNVSTRDAVAELARTAVVDAALGSIARLSARFEIIATSDYRPGNLRPTEEIDALWGAARVLNWHSLSDATAWLRDCAKEYLANNDNAGRDDALGVLLTGCVLVERFLQTVRLPWPDIANAEAEMLSSLQQLAPEQFGPSA